MQSHLLLTGALLALLAGCASQPAAERPVAQRCDSTRLAHLVGQAPDTATLEKARTQARAERVRVVEPGMAVTLEYDAQRLTLYTDEQGRIKLISCG
ncbi:MAG TPA: I78 family peptidase inhibitor [Pseudomonas sp.]|jgi:hypothetical protein|uniref:I78 family peptidase inhibitor n=1 Tax=Pseudomonas sp. TaxID=306 RepID=UPI002D14BA3B|nr:I78 family peptidase inhibitor [Pseudomonas sp.]HTO19599.1 I78 family peptidase inhibitor [Pseudomonas sp.]